MLEAIKRFIKDERGLGTAEIAIIAGFLALAAYGFGTYIVPKIKSAGNKVGTQLDDTGNATY